MMLFGESAGAISVAIHLVAKVCSVLYEGIACEQISIAVGVFVGVPGISVQWGAMYRVYSVQCAVCGFNGVCRCVQVCVCVCVCVFGEGRKLPLYQRLQSRLCTHGTITDHGPVVGALYHGRLWLAMFPLQTLACHVYSFGVFASALVESGFGALCHCRVALAYLPRRWLSLGSHPPSPSSLPSTSLRI